MDTVKELLKKLELAEVKANEAEYEYTKDYTNYEKEKPLMTATKFNLTYTSLLLKS